jgi:hypothetical protein
MAITYAQFHFAKGLRILILMWTYSNLCKSSWKNEQGEETSWHNLYRYSSYYGIKALMIQGQTKAKTKWTIPQCYKILQISAKHRHHRHLVRTGCASTFTSCFTGCFASLFKRSTWGLSALGCDLSLLKVSYVCRENIQWLKHTCLSGSILANPPLWLDWPPLEAISRTSSFGRLAKLPGLVFSVMLMSKVLDVKLCFI